jgi:hypothetical protein
VFLVKGVYFFKLKRCTDPEVPSSIPNATRMKCSGTRYSSLVDSGHGVYFLVGLERGPHSLLSTIEELLGRNNSGYGLQSRKYGRGNPLC